MDSGTAIAVLAVIKPTAQTILDAWQDARNFGEDIRGLSVRFSASKAYLSHYENLLFTKDKLPGIQGTLYETLLETDSRTILDMLGELQLLLNAYVATNRKYELESTRTADDVDLDQSKETRNAVILSTAISKDEEQAKLVGWVKKTWWTVWEKKGLEKLVRDFEKWIKRLRQFMKLIWGPLPFLNSLSQLRNLEKDQDAKNVGLLDDVSLRKLVATPTDTQAINVESLRIPTSRFTTSAGNHSYGSIEESSKVFVEYKSYEINRINVIHDVSSNRINQLIALLHEVDDARFKVLRCVNYFDDATHRNVGIIFELLSQMNGPPNTLFAALSCSSGSRPSLDARMRLARSLCETLLLLHSVNWLHKSIRSETILLLNADATLPVREIVPDLENPRLSGFEYSRLDNGFSYGYADFKHERNIYRHPDRWDQPSESFSKIHDIYSLGVILLEIGLWQPIISLERRERREERYRDGRSTRSRLSMHATKRLGFYTGEKYQNLVLRCLNADFGDLTGDDKIGSELQRQFGKNVSQALMQNEKSDP